MDGTAFKSDFYTILVKRYDMILGVKWLTQVSTIFFDFSKHEIVINWQGSKVQLRSEAETNQKIGVQLKSKGRFNQKAHACFLV